MMFKITQSVTVTGFIIFILGMLTFTPEIFLSGVIVMAVSAAQSMKQLEAIAIDETTVPSSNETPNFYAW